MSQRHRERASRRSTPRPTEPRQRHQSKSCGETTCEQTRLRSVSKELIRCVVRRGFPRGNAETLSDLTRAETECKRFVLKDLAHLYKAGRAGKAGGAGWEDFPRSYPSRPSCLSCLSCLSCPRDPRTCRRRPTRAATAAAS